MSVVQSDNHAIFVELPLKEKALAVLGHHTSSGKANVASSNASQSAAGALPTSLP